MSSRGPSAPSPTASGGALPPWSVADEFHVQIFPEDFPVNIANPENLHRLRQAFPGRKVSIAVGSDVVAHASSYRKPVEPDSIHTFDHIIFRRSGQEAVGGYGGIYGKVLELTLPEPLEEISSTRIREAVDANRDISNLVDPAVQEFIYRRGLYLREPQDKPLLRTEDLDFTDYPRPDASMEAMLEGVCPAAMVEKLWQCGDSLLLLRHGMQGQVLEPSATGSWSPVSCMTGWGVWSSPAMCGRRPGVGHCSSADCGCRTATSSGSWGSCC